MRLFIAIQLSDEIKDRLCRAIKELKREAVRGRFTCRDNLHLTLVFIGETNQTDNIKKAMDAVAAKAFTLTIGGNGRFRRNGGDIYWAGVRPSQTLLSIYHQLYTALTALEFTLEDREYKPHLTLGREVLLPDRDDKNSFQLTISDSVMPVTEIHLVKSERIDGRMVYTSLYRTSLKV